MPLVKKAALQLKEQDQRLLFALYDEQKETQYLRDEVGNLADQVQSLQEVIAGLGKSIDDLKRVIALKYK